MDSANLGKAAHPPYSLEPYSIDALRRLLSDEARAPLGVVARKLHLDYFEGYFKDLGAKTILVERNYIDRDYLEDFASYYVRCFKDYPHVCTRLHFFRDTITEKDFELALKGADAKTLSASYLGFVVVKPLPQTIIGRTCLRTYEDDNGRRHYPSTREYEANIFGIRLKAEKTLAFQEQDRVAAACATSALWSVFQGTGKLFQHPIPSPVAITRAATIHWPRETRTLPNDGLNAIQMAHAIRDVGLEPLMVRADRSDILKSNLYAYLRAKIPLLLIVDLYDAPHHPVKFMGTPGYDGEHGYLGKHAVAVTGYSLGLQQPMPYGRNGMLVRASRIDKLYAHDDQVGPFARMGFAVAPMLHSNGSQSDRDFLNTSWRSPRSGLATVLAQPENLLVPLYHKIRIPFDAISNAVIDLDQLLEGMRIKGMAPFDARLEWDIYLTTVNEFKSEIRASTVLDERRRLDIQLQPLPKFLWCATAFCNNEPQVGLVFDATDIEQGSFFLRGIEYNTSLTLVIKALASGIPEDPGVVPRAMLSVLAWFAEQPNT